MFSEEALITNVGLHVQLRSSSGSHTSHISHRMKTFIGGVRGGIEFADGGFGVNVTR